MAVDHVKSTIITNLDASPIVTPTAGEGAPAALMFNEGYATAIAASSAAATYQLLRVPSNCKPKLMFFESEAQGAGKFDIGLYYATDGQGGRPTSLLLANTISAALFASAIDCAAAVLPTEVLSESGTLTLDKRTMPLWQMAGLASDPGGNFDIVATVVTTAVTTGTGKFGIRLAYTV